MKGDREMRRYVIISVLALSFLAGVVLAGQEEEPDTTGTESVENELDVRVREIFGNSCAASTCHGGDHPKMDLSLDAEDIPENMIDVPSVQNSEYMRIDTIDPSSSYLLLKITGSEGIKGKKMPIMAPPLSDEEVKAIMTWVREFASAQEEEEEGDEDPDDDE
jgi:hypothetical protein